MRLSELKTGVKVNGVWVTRYVTNYLQIKMIIDRRHDYN